MSLFEDTFQNDTPERKKNLNKIRLFFLSLLIFLIMFTKNQLNLEQRINNPLVINKIYISQKFSVYITI